VFSLDPRTSDLEYEITDLHDVNLFAPLLLTVSVLPGTWNFSSRFTLFWSSEQFTWAKITSRLGGEIRFRRILRRAQRVRAGSVCVVLCLGVALHVLLKGHVIVFLCNTKPARNIGHYFVSKQLHDFIVFFIMDLVNQFVYSMVLYLLAHNESFHEISASTCLSLHSLAVWLGSHSYCLRYD
jgi:hypothetical protein